MSVPSTCTIDSFNLLSTFLTAREQLTQATSRTSIKLCDLIIFSHNTKGMRMSIELNVQLSKKTNYTMTQIQNTHREQYKMQPLNSLMKVARTLLLVLLSASTSSAFRSQSTTSFASCSSSSPSLVRSSFKARPSKTSTFLKFRSPSLHASIQTNDDLKDPDSLISAQDERTQQSSFFLICGGILGGSVAFLSLYNFLEIVLPPSIFAPFYTVLPYVLSSLFIAAGIAHFALEETFTSFVPPKGSWGGLWQVPAPGLDELGLTYEQYHSFWSGVAEIIVGSWLIVATATTNGILKVGDAAGDVSTFSSVLGSTAIPAALMWMLTAAVTPANIYMYTHNPVVPRIPALPYPWGHAARGLLQCALLAVFCKLTIHYVS